MIRRIQPRKMRNGVTLIELLVVGTLMLTLAAVSVPAIKPMMEAQVTASAASSVSTYLNRARARAMTTGRPCGVVFECFEGTYDSVQDEGSACLILRQVEVPPLYTGLDDNAVVDLGSVYTIPDHSSPYCGLRVCALITAADKYWASMVGEEKEPLIQLNHIGPYYPIYKKNGSYYIVEIPELKFPTRSGVPFKVMRDPRPTMTAPIGLTKGAVVDLEFSGNESGTFEPGGNVIVMFSPSGEVQYVEDKKGRYIPTETLYFLIGRWDRICALGYEWDPVLNEYVTITDDGLWNYEDASNYWLTINPRTGLVTTAEVNQPLTYTNNKDVVNNKIYESREFARRSKRNLGGH